ncbi:DUF4166 domain-containing protein [Rathayibacter sp. YIM 133350]|uniref:DUF4166 domain-containing protein n=1 Tax=Rathayibacter sp. YIM 133350 TaxID=3131992 RepID=UPI00307FBA46
MRTSPYERALGGRIHDLDPRLRAYFSTIPEGQVGQGRGTFDVVGTPRRWLWPVLWLLSGDDVLWPVWQGGVPFEIENRQVGDALVARRVFHLSGGDRVMVDEMRCTAGRLVDALGSRGDVRAGFEATVDAGALQLDSRAVGFRIRHLRVTVPRLIRPRVRLVERIDGASGRQHVRLTITLPVLGLIYEYAGSFEYELRPEGEA